MVLIVLWLRAPDDRKACWPHIFGAIVMLMVTVCCGVFALFLVDRYEAREFIALLEDDGVIFVFPIIMAFTWWLTARIAKEL